MRSFKLDIVSPDGTVFSGEAERLLVRTTDGDVEILAGHTDLFATLGTGRVKLTTRDGVKYGSSSGGLLTGRGGEVTLAAISFEFADTIDEARAARAMARAEERIREAKDNRELELAKARLARALNRINVAKMK